MTLQFPKRWKACCSTNNWFPPHRMQIAGGSRWRYQKPQYYLRHRYEATTCSPSKLNKYTDLCEMKHFLWRVIWKLTLSSHERKGWGSYLGMRAYEGNGAFLASSEGTALARHADRHPCQGGTTRLEQICLLFPNLFHKGMHVTSFIHACECTTHFSLSPFIP